MKDDVEMIKIRQRGRSLSKVDLHVTISEPNSNDRRSRWLNDKMRFGNKPGLYNCDKTSVQDDSGYQGDSLPRIHTHPHPLITLSSDDGSYAQNGINRPFEYDSGNWRSRDKDPEEKPKLRSTCSLNCSCNHPYFDDFTHHSHSHTEDDDIDDTEMQYSLSRQNGIRHSTRRHRDETVDIESPTESAYSISSESEGSQGEIEPPIDDPMLQVRREKVRKQSVFFTSRKTWNNESITSSFRDLSPSIGSVLEAAWNGDLNRLEELLGRENPLNVNASDVYGRTPLHLAAASGHVEAVELLLKKGADVEVCDFQQKATPLMCAAGCGSLPVVEMLLTHGANVNAGFESGKTALHWAVQAESVGCVKKLLESGALQNPPAAYSETALHVAASIGHLECLQLLIEHGGDVTLIKGNSRSTALHLAAWEGNIDCMRYLLRYGASHASQDARGQTPLHISAASDTDATALLLSVGADPHLRDSNGRTPLHCAVGRGSRAAECVRLLIDAQAEVNAQDCYGYTPLHLAAVNESSGCASILLNNGGDTTAKTKAGTSALSLLFRRIPDVVKHLVDRLNSAVTVHDHDPADPDCEVRLDFRAIVTNAEKKTPDKHGKIPVQMYYHHPKKETEFLTCLIAAGNKKILAHPLSEAFLHLKWRCVRKFFWASLCFQTALVLLYTIYIINVYLMQCPYHKELAYYQRMERLAELQKMETATTNPPLPLPAPLPTQSFQDVELLKEEPRIMSFMGDDDGNQKNQTRLKREITKFSWFSLAGRQRKKLAMTTTTAQPVEFARNVLLGNVKPGINAFSEINSFPKKEGESEDVNVKDDLCQLGTTLTVVWCLLIGLTFILAIKEIFQIAQAPRAYVISSENWGQWALIGSVSMTTWHTSYPGFHLSYWQYPAAAFGIFLAYSLMLLQVGRQPALGLYVQMLGKVAANFGLFILAYLCLLIAFALAFCVIYPGNPAFSSPPLAFMKVLTMMVGEVDYEEQFYTDDPAQPIPYPITAHVLHTAFVVFISIILMNLLVGLAVHDIQGLQKGAKLNRLSRQTALISRLESFIMSKRLQAFLPKTVGQTLQKNALLVPSSYKWTFSIRPNDPRDKRLPKEIKQAVLRLAAANYVNKHGAKILPNDRSHIYNQNSEISFRKLDQRIDRLQQQIDSALKTLTDNNEKILSLLNNKTEKEDTDVKTK
ncbi:unnamed protein product [Allacma fusca]|uniref:Ion transport domain-containing protein n=1 Tax=Allacma fusca TaxID=39272 RepID=A0A8J2KFW0_9HEXA|nr:unnamed protein product [Allacma fusca]